MLDTAVNAAGLGFRSVAILLDATRAAHIPGFGAHGSGFLTAPADVRRRLERAQDLQARALAQQEPNSDGCDAAGARAGGVRLLRFSAII